MSYDASRRPTQRSLRPDAVAYTDPQFRADHLWSPYAQPVHHVERGEDVELTGELTLVGSETLATGHQLHGRYATFWFTGDEITGMTLQADGAQPVGAVSGSFCDVVDGAVGVTTAAGATLSPAGESDGRAYLREGGQTLVSVPVGDDTLIPFDVLLDRKHQPCGFIINGDLDWASWESRILPEETKRVSSQELLTALQSAHPEDRPRVVSLSSGFLKRQKTHDLGHLGDLHSERAWQFPTVGVHEALTVAELIELLTDPLFRVGPDLGVEATGGDPLWLTEIRQDSAGLQLVVADVLLPVSAL